MGAQSEDLIKSIEKKVRGFKVICTHFYPQDDKMMKIWEFIASRGLPIIFHSGILYNDRPSAQYNRPSNFESLFYIDKLRFSLAHIGWPWTDEMIAVYGKWEFFRKKGYIHSDMYIDLSPGTPTIYRKHVLEMLFSVDYSFIKRSVYWGTDSSATYNVEKISKRLNKDKELLGNILSVEEQNDVMRNNVLTFVGRR